MLAIKPSSSSENRTQLINSINIYYPSGALAMTIGLEHVKAFIENGIVKKNSRGRSLIFKNENKILQFKRGAL